VGARREEKREWERGGGSITERREIRKWEARRSADVGVGVGVGGVADACDVERIHRA
jgi:hypothetical protein